MKIRNQIILIFTVLLAFTFIGEAQTQIASNNEQLRVIKAVAPNYPSAAILANYVSTVELEADIDNEGKPINIRSKLVPNRFSPRILQVAARNAAVRWRFNETPNKLQKRRVNLTFIFRLSDENTEQGVFFNPPYEVEIIGNAVKIKS